MLLLVAKAHETLVRWRYPNVGRFCGPRNFHRMRDTVKAGYVWAADNDAFNGFDEVGFVRMLDGLAGVPGCLFVTCPDVVADAEATFLLYNKWVREIAKRDLPVGYVAQDGIDDAPIPWNGFKAIFIGGSDDFKQSGRVHELVLEAREKGKWVHMGRVNTWQRMEHAASMGVDSIDGTQLSMFSDTYLEQWVGYAQRPPQESMVV